MTAGPTPTCSPEPSHWDLGGGVLLQPPSQWQEDLHPPCGRVCGFQMAPACGAEVMVVGLHVPVGMGWRVPGPWWLWLWTL